MQAQRVRALTNVIRLAGGAATRRARVFRQFAYPQGKLAPLAKEIATLQVAAYEGRLQQLADAMGHRGPVQLADPAVLRAIAQDAKDVAFGVLHTHNTELRNLLNRQPRTAKQSELSATARQWERDRAEWKARQIALTEGVKARDRADRDVLRRNDWHPRQRVTPRTAAEARCADLVGRGWMRGGDAPPLPLHINCVHGYEYDTDLGKLAAQRRDAGKPLWIGDTITEKERST